MNVASLGQSLIDVTLIGLLLGTGLPALFALGVRFSTPALDPKEAEEGHLDPGRQHFTNKTLAGLCYAVIILAVLAGIFWITKATFYQYFGWDIFGTEVAAS